MNPIYSTLNGNNPMNMVQQIRQFAANFKGDPKQEVEKLLQSGKVSQAQLNQAQQMARQFQGFFK